MRGWRRIRGGLPSIGWKRGAVAIAAIAIAAAIGWRGLASDDDGRETGRADMAARAAELSVAAHDVGELEGLGDDVDALVTDLEALRLGLEEVQRPSTGTA